MRLASSRAVVFPLLSCVALACVALRPVLADEAPAPAPRPHPRNGIVLVTIDSLRADHLGCYGAGVASFFAVGGS